MVKEGKNYLQISNASLSSPPKNHSSWRILERSGRGAENTGKREHYCRREEEENVVKEGNNYLQISNASLSSHLKTIHHGEFWEGVGEEQVGVKRGATVSPPSVFKFAIVVDDKGEGGVDESREKGVIVGREGMEGESTRPPLLQSKGVRKGGRGRRRRGNKDCSFLNHVASTDWLFGSLNERGREKSQCLSPPIIPLS
ncbi:hypothetical protein SUGI_0559100 [Cryptomeria japonica]|nr:hypothetical protein SUGI_0559100 [Cryptomeria japonica]